MFWHQEGLGKRGRISMTVRIKRIAGRDEFPAAVCRQIAQGVGYRCSRPECRRLTVAAGSAPNTTVSIGVAAHIAGAAPGGPRYDESMSSRERSSAENAIWLCQSCSRLIDRDIARYTRPLLSTWKADAERAAGLALTHGDIPEVAADIATLQLHAERAIASNAAGRQIATPDAGAVHIQRAVVDEVLRAVTVHDVLLVAEAGAGKTAVLLDSAKRLIGTNERVVFLDATDRRLLDARSLLGLQHPLEDVLQRWGEGERPGYLIIDGLDAIRSSPAFDALLRLVRAVQNGATPWRVLAATRNYDLESAVQLRALFTAAATPVIGPEFTDARFRDVNHIAVRGLSDAEFAALGAQSPALGGLLEEASNDLRRLLRNPFNLST